MDGKPNKEFGKEFGKRKPVATQTTAPVKRSHHVALLLMGTFAVGGGAYALMPGENCAPNRPGMAAPSGLQTSAECPPRGSSSGGGHGSSGGSWSRSNFVRFRRDTRRIRFVRACVRWTFFRRLTAGEISRRTKL
jgi:hypothetical protein